MDSKHNEKYIQLGLNIAYYRKLNGLNQLELAERVGISRTHMSNIEAPNMETAVSLEVLFNIADVLNVPVVKLFEIR